MSKYKYSEEDIRLAVKNSTSYSEAVRVLNDRAFSGGLWRHIKKRITKLGIDTSHFTGHRTTLGKSSHNKKSAEEILHDNYTNRPSAQQLRRALLEIGIPHKCTICQCPPEWNGKKLILHVDHIDGNRLNNTQENLRFLCPNCHSQTPNFGVKNSKQCAPKNSCKNCGCPIHRQSYRCRGCANKHKTQQTKIEWPDTQELLDMVRETSYTDVGKKLGVTANAVKKRIINHGGGTHLVKRIGCDPI